MTGYDYSRMWWEYVEDNPDKVHAGMYPLYFWCLELNNRLGWKPKFGLPRDTAMENCRLSKNSYYKAFDSLVEIGAIEVVQKGKNQSKSTIIALPKFGTAGGQQLVQREDSDWYSEETATGTAKVQQEGSGCDSGRTVVKPLKTIKPLKTKEEELLHFDFLNDEKVKSLLLEFWEVKKKKKASMKNSAKNRQFKMLQKFSNGDVVIVREMVRKSVDSGWPDFYPLKKDDLKRIKPQDTVAEFDSNR